MLDTTIIPSKVILLISMYFLPEPGGGALAAYHRAKTLKKIGYNVIVLTGFPTYPTGKINDPKYKRKIFIIEEFEGFAIIRIRIFPVKHSGHLLRLLMYLSFVLATILFYVRIKSLAGKIDIVYARAPIIFSCFSGYFFSKMSSSEFVYEVPDLWPEELIMLEPRIYKLILPFGKILARISYSLPDKIITVSRLARNIILNNYGTSVPIFSIPTGVDPSKYPRIPKYESRLKLIDADILETALLDKFIILYAGIITSAQKVENLFPIAKSLENDTDIAFVIVGEGDQREFIEKETQKYTNVYLLSYQPRDIMPLLVHSADMCSVLLSNAPIFDIAFPTKFYEALACNKPILAICRGELSEIINSNNIGLASEANRVNEMADFITKLKNSKQRYSDIEQNVSNTLKSYTLDTIATTLGSVLNGKKNNLPD